MTMNNQHKRGWGIAKIAVFILVTCISYGIAQRHKVPTYGPDIAEKSIIPKRDSINKEPVTGENEIMPRFPGDEDALMKYIHENLVYPEDAKNSKTEGKVIVRFKISKEGKVEKIEVVRGLTISMNKEAIRIISTLPDWTPGEQVFTSAHYSRKQKVDVYYTIPISFKLK
jgi:TonB family protein